MIIYAHVHENLLCNPISLEKLIKLTKLFTVSVASLTLAFSPLFAQTVFAQAEAAGAGAAAGGGAGAAAGAGAASAAAVGGLTTAAVVGGVVAVAAGVAVAVSNKGDSSSGTTGTTGTR